MKKILIFSLLLSSNAFASFPLVKFSNLYGEFANDKGKAYAESAKYDLEQVKLSHKEIEVKFNKKEKHLVIHDQNTIVELKFDFSFLNVFKFLSFDGANMQSTKTDFDINLHRLNLFIQPNDFALEEISMSADLTEVNGPNSDDATVLDGFVLNGSLGIKTTSFGTINSDEFFKMLIAENPALTDLIQTSFIPKAIPLTARNLSLRVEKGLFKGQVFLDSWLNANLYIGGEIKNLTKDNKMQINLNKAKLGYFSIKRFILKKIRNLNLDSIEVNGQVITVNLGKVPSTKN